MAAARGRPRAIPEEAPLNFPTHPSIIAAIGAAWIKILQPPPRPRGLIAFARTLRVRATDPITGDDVWVPFVPEDHPNQFEVLKAFAEGGYTELVVLGPVQDGKTYAAIVVIILYCLIELRQGCGLMLPEQEKAEEVWLEKLVPVIRQSGYGWILPDEGRGSKSGAARFMTMNTGATMYLVGAGAKNESGQSSFTVRIMAVDERSKIRPRWVHLAQARTKSYDMAGRFVTTSTIGDDETDDTLMAYRDSTGNRSVYQCPHCVAQGHPSGGWQAFEWDLPSVEGQAVPFSRFIFDPTSDETARTSVRLRCLHVAEHLLTDDERKAALRNHRSIATGQSVAPDGTITGPASTNSRKGIRWHSLESPLKTMGKLAVELGKALLQRDKFGNHEPLRQFYRDERVEGYTGVAEGKPGTITNKNLAKISEVSRILKRIVPSWARYLVIAQDVQKREHYWVLMAYGHEERWAIVDYGYESLVPEGRDREAYEPTREDRHRVLDKINDMANRGWQVEGRPLEADRMQPVLRGIDIGWRQEELFTWITGTQWIAVKGLGQRDEAGRIISAVGDDKNVPELLRPFLRITLPPGWSRECWWVTGDIARHRIHSALLRDGGPATGFIPQGLKSNDQLVLHLSAVVWTTAEDTGKQYWREKVHPRWDLLDATIYNYALARWYAEQLATASRTATKPQAQRPPIVPNRTHHVQRRSSLLNRRRDYE